MRKWIFVGVLLLLIVTPRCYPNECFVDSDCDDGNECTDDACYDHFVPGPVPYEFSLCGPPYTEYWCTHEMVDDGTPCEVGVRTGVCESGECRLDGEAPDDGV